MRAPIANQNAQRSRIWRDAIERAVRTRGARAQVEALDALAEKLLEQCDKGDVAALRELGDRLEGRPTRDVDMEHSGSVLVYRPDSEDAALA